MKPAEDSAWLKSIVALNDGFETRVVEQFTDRLIRLAQSRLPARLNRRFDPEDIVQSVFNSFFHRNRDERFDIRCSNDLWRLLAAMTYRKSMQAIEYHSRQRRDFGRETNQPTLCQQGDNESLNPEPSVSSIAIMVDLLDQILERLPTEHQEILHLRLMDYSIDEIADQVAVSTRTVDRALRSAREIAAQLIRSHE